MNEADSSFWFDEVWKIHQVASAKGYSETEAKLFAYIHVKCFEVGWDSLLFGQTEICALKVILGDELELNTFPSALKSKLAKLSNMVKKVDLDIRQKTGKEFVLGAEIRQRLKFHQEEGFKERILRAYFDSILPGVNQHYKQLIAI